MKSNLFRQISMQGKFNPRKKQERVDMPFSFGLGSEMFHQQGRVRMICIVLF